MGEFRIEITSFQHHSSFGNIQNSCFSLLVLFDSASLHLNSQPLFLSHRIAAALQQNRPPTTPSDNCNTANMKYLEYTPLQRISDFLSHINLGQCVIESRLEAYSCKHTGADKKLSFSLEIEILDYLGKSSEVDSPSPVDNFLCRSSRKTLIYLVLTLNHMYPDYDFSAVQAHQYFSEVSWDSFKNTVETYFVDVNEEWSEETGGSLIEALQKALDEVIKLSECEIYSYNPSADADPQIEKGSNWSFNFLFYNKRLKRVVGFCCSSLSNLLTDGSPEPDTVSDGDGEIFDNMDI